MNKNIVPESDLTPIAMLFDTKHQDFSLNTLTFNDLCKAVENPSSKVKLDAPCLAPQLSGVKSKAEVQNHNEMNTIIADLDDENLTLEEVKQKLAILGIDIYIIYSTASSMRLNKGRTEVNGKRWRIIIPLKTVLVCSMWQTLQEALNNLLGADTCTARITQVAFMPNNPPITDPSETQHYEYFIGG